MTGSQEVTGSTPVGSTYVLISFLISEGFSIVFSEREGHEEIQLRKKQEISQTELAKQRGIHKNEMGQYERNEVFPSIEIAHKIADIIDVSLDFLT